MSAAIRIHVQSSTSEGAVLVTKHETFCRDAQLRGRFAKFIINHHKEWVKFANEVGHGVDPEELILVTGCDMTSEFSMLAFAKNERERQITLEVNTGAVQLGGANLGLRTLSAHSPLIFRNRGPYLSPGQETVDMQNSQCVFVRGYRLYRRAWLFKKVIEAGAGFHDIDSDEGDPHQPHAFLSAEDSNFTSETVTSEVRMHAFADSETDRTA